MNRLMTKSSAAITAMTNSQWIVKPTPKKMIAKMASRTSNAIDFPPLGRKRLNPALGCALRGRSVQRLDHARVAGGVLAAEKRLGAAADRVAQVLELEAVRIRALDLDSLHLAVAAELDHRAPGVPRVLAYELGQPLRLPRVPPHERLHQQAACVFGGVEAVLGIGGGSRERLLAQHVLARLERADRPRHVERVRQRDVDGLDVRVLEERLVATVRALDPPLARVRVGAGLVAARDRDEIGLRRGLRRRDDHAVDVRRREDCPADGIGHREATASLGPLSAERSIASTTSSQR